MKLSMRLVALAAVLAACLGAGTLAASEISGHGWHAVQLAVVSAFQHFQAPVCVWGRGAALSPAGRGRGARGPGGTCWLPLK